MEKIIEEIFEKIKDYRADEEDDSVMITKGRIKKWIDQFDEKDKEFILNEMNHLLTKRYVSKKSITTFLTSLVTYMTKELKYISVKDFLDNTIFLDYQEEGKSQKKMLELLAEIVESEFNYDIANLGMISKANHIYIDDILCTGLTLYNDIMEWSGEDFDKKKTNKDAVENGDTKLIFIYIFLHDKNFYKKKAQLKRNLSPAFSNKITTYRIEEIENSSVGSSKLNFIFPLEADQPDLVKKYKDEIVETVDEYTSEKNYKTEEEFYRNANQPTTEEFFTSSENRQRFENILLKKGIEILENTNSRKRNIRALGYSLPSQKDFGFGTFCFTWRNIPNNLPLVFWYSGGGFYPLFVKH